MIFVGPVGWRGEVAASVADNKQVWEHREQKGL